MAEEERYRERQRAYTTALKTAPRSVGYRGEMGPGTYQPSQLEAYKVCRQLALEVTNQVVSDLAEGNMVRTEAQLEEQYKAWERADKSMRRRMERQAKEEQFKP